MDKVSQLFSTVICNEFLPLLSHKTGVNLEELVKCWNDYNGTGMVIPSLELPTLPKAPPPTTSKKIYSQTELNKLKIKDLKVICDELKIIKGGVKQQIVDRILEKCGVQKTEDEAKEQPVASPPKIKHDSVSSEESDDEKKASPKKLNLEKLRAPAVKISQNDNGHWIHEETRIVFTSDEEYIDGIKCRVAIGFEDEDGTVEDLTAEMIQRCHQYGFRYNEPTNIIV